MVLQLPLPLHLDAGALLAGVLDDKDVDCLKESSVRRCLLRAEPTVSPCISSAVEEVLRSLDLLKPHGRPQRQASPPHVPHVLLLGVPSLLAFPLELCLEAAGCRVSCLPEEEPPESARAALPQADVLLIGARRPDLVAAQWVRSGCVILDLGLATISAPAPAAAPGPEGSSDPLGGEAGDGGGGPGGEAPTARDVLCLCCSDGLSSITAALRMRNASHLALVQQGFLEQDKPPQPIPPPPPPLRPTAGSERMHPYPIGADAPTAPPFGTSINGAVNGAAASVSGAISRFNPFAATTPPVPPHPEWGTY